MSYNIENERHYCTKKISFSYFINLQKSRKSLPLYEEISQKFHTKHFFNNKMLL